MASMEPRQAEFEIVPPIIVDEHGSVEPYASVDSVIRDIEVVDVLNNEYSFYDSTGRVLEARVQKGKVTLVPTSRLEPNSETLRGHIMQVLRLLGVPDEGLPNLPFSDLSRLLFERWNKQA